MVDMAALLREALDQHRALALEQQLELIADPQPALCRGEHELLLQVATNLLSNGMDYNQPGGWVRASTAVREDFSDLILKRKMGTDSHHRGVPRCDGFINQIF